jgi:hypothetical protein
MSKEEFTDIPDDASLEFERAAMGEDYQYDLGLTRSLGGLANSQTEIIEPFLEPGSEAAKAYARQTGASGIQRWMEPFSRLDILGLPTVFNDNLGRSDRRV